MFDRDKEFNFVMQSWTFEKSDAKAGQTMRIGGFCSDESRDQEGETVLSRGLSFEKFLSKGWYNDNHSKKTVDILGYPDYAKYMKKGEKLPGGIISLQNGWYTEGYLCNTSNGRAIFELGKSLEDVEERNLGFSVEGKILERKGPSGKIIAKAEVRNVAITGCPVNDNTSMMILAKSLDEVNKSLEVGQSINPPAQTSSGDGFPVRTESLEGQGEKVCSGCKKPRNKCICISKAEAINLILQAQPYLTYNLACSIVDYAFLNLKKEV